MVGLAALRSYCWRLHVPHAVATRQQICRQSGQNDCKFPHKPGTDGRGKIKTQYSCAFCQNTTVLCTAARQRGVSVRLCTVACDWLGPSGCVVLPRNVVYMCTQVYKKDNKEKKMPSPLLLLSCPSSLSLSRGTNCLASSSASTRGFNR